MMFTSIFLSFGTLSAALRRAAIHTQNLDEVAAADMQQEVPHHILSNLKAEMSAMAENVAHTERILHNESLDSAFEEIALRQADTSSLVEAAAHKADIALMATTSKLVVKRGLSARKTNMVHEANASALVTNAEKVAHKANASHDLNTSGLLFGEKRDIMAHNLDAAHEAQASERSRTLRAEITHKAHALALVVKKERLAHEAALLHREDTSKLSREELVTHKIKVLRAEMASLDADVAQEAQMSERSRKLHKEIAHKEGELTLLVEKERLAHAAALLHQADLLHHADTSKFSKKELAAHSISVLHAELAALEATRPSPSQVLASELASLHRAVSPGIQPSTTTEAAQLPAPAAAVHLASDAQGASPAEKMRAAFENTPAPTKLSWDDHMNASVPMPSQGFEGGPALHEDQRSFTADWMREHSNGDTTDKEKVCNICRSHMDNPWCQNECPELMEGRSGMHLSPEVTGGSSELSSEEGLRSAAEAKSIALFVLATVMPLTGIV